MRKLIVAYVILLCLTSGAAAQEDTAYSLTILHTDNVLDAHQPGSDGAGGTARAATLIERARADNANVLLVDSGDRFLSPQRADANARIMNELGYDAMTVGNHEFNGGNDGLADFLSMLDFPALVANVDFSAAPTLNDLIAPTHIIELDGEQIGIIGLANEGAPVLSSPGPELIFQDDETAATQEAVAALEAQGIDKIILIAHRDTDENSVLAASVSGVDVIVGGSDGRLLNNELEAADGSYPIVAESLTGDPVLVVQTTEANRFLGELNVTFDSSGVLTEWGGNTRFLSEDIEPNAEMQTLIDELEADAIDSATVIGETDVRLVGSEVPCREEECNIGNLITDALRQQNETDIAVYNSGGIRASIPAGDITDVDVLEVLPFDNSVSTLELIGADIRAMLEHSVSLGGEAEISGSGRFLQVSGLRFAWNPTRPVGSRVESIEILNDEGDYIPLDEDAIYSVVTNDFIRSGGDGYVMLAENAIDPFDFGPPVDEVLTTYIRVNTPIAPETEGRITRLSD